MSPNLRWGDITSNNCVGMPTHKSPKPAVDSIPLQSVCLNLSINQISLKSDKVEISTFRRPFPEKPEVAENFRFRILAQDTRFT